jgi:hypothetical protein
MTREEETIQALRNHIEVLEERLTALEQEPKYCDRNICTSNEYNGIGCEECEVTKSQILELEQQEPCEDAVSRQAVLETIDSRIYQIKRDANAINKSYSHLSFAEGVHDGYCRLKCDLRILPSVTPIHRDRTVQDFADKCRECGKQKKGKWCKQNDDYFNWYECSECGYGSEGKMQYSSEYDVRTKYCPNCGSFMMGED